MGKAAVAVGGSPNMMTVASTGASGSAKGITVLKGNSLGLGLGLGMWGTALLGGLAVVAVYGYVRSRKLEKEQNRVEKNYYAENVINDEPVATSI